MSTAAARSPSGLFAVVVTRLAGLWVLAGAIFKLLWGNPADLPLIVQELPPDLGLTYRVAIAAELSVGLLALLKPRWAWLLLIALLVLFNIALVTQIQAGAESCGCFGEKIPVPPAVMLGIDTAILLLLIVSRPWESMGRDAVNDLVLIVVLTLALPLPWILDRESKSGDTGNTPGVAWTELKVKDWSGRRLADTDLAQWVDTSKLPDDGLWLFWRDSCEVCADVLLRMEGEEWGLRPVVLIHLPEGELAEDQRKVHRLPDAPHVHKLELPADRDWLLVTPGVLVVEKGCVVWTMAPLMLEDYEKTLDPPDPRSCEE